jgi:uncharacterized membrane protein
MSDSIETSEAVIHDEITHDDRLWAMGAYMLSPVVPIIILSMPDKKNRPFIREHNIQALIVGLISLALGFFLAFTVIVPLFLYFYMVYLGIRAYRGKSVHIPLITDFVNKQGWA